MTTMRVLFVLLVASLIATACGLTPSATPTRTIPTLAPTNTRQTTPTAVPPTATPPPLFEDPEIYENQIVTLIEVSDYQPAALIQTEDGVQHWIRADTLEIQIVSVQDDAGLTDHYMGGHSSIPLPGGYGRMGSGAYTLTGLIDASSSESEYYGRISSVLFTEVQDPARNDLAVVAAWEEFGRNLRTDLPTEVDLSQLPFSQDPYQLWRTMCFYQYLVYRMPEFPQELIEACDQRIEAWGSPLVTLASSFGGWAEYAGDFVVPYTYLLPAGSWYGGDLSCESDLGGLSIQGLQYREADFSMGRAIRFKVPMALYIGDSQGETYELVLPGGGFVAGFPASQVSGGMHAWEPFYRIPGFLFTCDP